MNEPSADRERLPATRHPLHAGALGRPRLRVLLVWLVALGISVSGVLGLLSMLSGGVVARDAVTEPVSSTRDGLPVEVVTARYVTGYAVHEHFVGRLEASRETKVAFERSGLVTEVLVDEGDRVARGDVLARLDVAPLLSKRARLEAELEAVRADLELARLTEARHHKLLQKGYTPVARYDEARHARRALEAKLAEVEASIAGLDIDLEKSELRAPFAGTIARRTLDPGAVVGAGAPLVELLDTGRPIARVGLSTDAAAALRHAARFTIESRGMELDAALEAARPNVDADTRTIEALFRVEDAKGIPLGELVDLSIERRVESDGFWLPLSALSEGPKGLWTVFTVKNGPLGPIAGREAVEVLHVEGERVFVRGTVRDGTRVVTTGAHRVIKGQALAPQPAAVS